MLRKLSAILMTLCLLTAALTPWAAAAGGLRLVTSSQQAASQEVGFSSLPSNCQSLQATFILSNSDATYDFLADDALNALPGIYTTYQQEGGKLTVYVTTKTGVLADNGILTLGAIVSEDNSVFTVERAANVKLVGSDYSENIYNTVDGGGSDSGGSGDGSGGNSKPDGKPDGKPDTKPDALPFEDVPSNAWYAKAVRYVYEKGLMSGTSMDTFAPNTPMSRAMIWTVLAAYEGENTSGGTPWYAPGQNWAVSHGISDGSSPDGSITREQLATMLWRYAGSPTPSETLTKYLDADAVNQWAVPAMAWAVENGLISGMGDGMLVPQGSATRAQVATILMQFVEHLGA